MILRIKIYCISAKTMISKDHCKDHQEDNDLAQDIETEKKW